MARLTFILFLLLLPPALLPAGAAPAPASIQLGRFGTVPVVHPKGEPSQVVLLLSDGDGLGAPESDTAAALARQGALVFEIDTPRYLVAANHGKVRCLYPAADLEALSQFGQRTLGLAAYKPPILVGNDAGATLAYGALAQAPPGTFAGAVSAGFCPVLDSPRQLCQGNGLREDRSWKQGQRLLPSPQIGDPWLVLASPAGTQCSLGPPAGFVGKIPHAQMIPGQLPQALAVFAERSRQAAAAHRDNPLKDLPLTEVPAEGPETNTLAVILSGSGGWVGLDRQMGRNFAQRGVPVVGISSLAYFWKPKTPDGTSQDLARILDHYLAAWHKKRVLVVGYSQGADIVPFMVDRLPEPLRSRVSLVALIGPDSGAQFNVHPDGWMSGRKPDPEAPVAPEIARLKGLRVLCVFGDKETDSLCPQLDQRLVERFEVTGGHGFAGHAPVLAERFMAGAGLPPHGPGPARTVQARPGTRVRFTVRSGAGPATSP
jgi:type IV secretory pathway VirJ component